MEFRPPTFPRLKCLQINKHLSNMRYDLVAASVWDCSIARLLHTDKLVIRGEDRMDGEDVDDMEDYHQGSDKAPSAREPEQSSTSSTSLVLYNSPDPSAKNGWRAVLCESLHARTIRIVSDSCEETCGDLSQFRDNSQCSSTSEFGIHYDPREVATFFIHVIKPQTRSHVPNLRDGAVRSCSDALRYPPGQQATLLNNLSEKGTRS